MKASELIETLKEVIEKKGDREMCTLDDDGSPSILRGIIWDDEIHNESFLLCDDAEFDCRFSGDEDGPG